LERVRSTEAEVWRSGRRKSFDRGPRRRRIEAVTIISNEERTYTSAIVQACWVDAHCVKMERIPVVRVRRKKVRSVRRLQGVSINSEGRMED
jgi:hypothetical protein